ncbi:unnamed protein product [Taenia asiatica]|uniref:Basigin n=1 Tax=Taenia asiatica TaxID=60517 RepID=A0A0R3WD59_TAEAS|nr:unnamed protein product [Taenia asiatica]
MTVCDAYSPRITVLDMDGNEKYVPDIAIPVATSVSFICRANGVIKSDFVWKKASFSSQDYFEVRQSKLVVIDRKNGESKITFTETSFDKAGIYQCETSIYSARVNLHVYGIVDSGGTDVKSSPVTKDFHQVSITNNVPDLSIHPTAFCKFQVGQNGVNYATVRWYGEGLKQHRDMFHVTEYKNAATVTPVLVVRPTAETVYEGDAYNLTCEIIAYPRAQTGDITWRRNSQPLRVEDPSTGRLAASPTYDPEGRVHLLSVQSHHDTLAFSVLASADRAVYVCSVKTSVGNNSYGIFVRVKSSKSTFWPLLGIGVELLVLTAFILVYERNRRIKKSKPEPPTLNDGQASGPPKSSSRESGINDVTESEESDQTAERRSLLGRYLPLEP